MVIQACFDYRSALNPCQGSTFRVRSADLGAFERRLNYTFLENPDRHVSSTFLTAPPQFRCNKKERTRALWGSCGSRSRGLNTPCIESV